MFFAKVKTLIEGKNLHEFMIKVMNRPKKFPQIYMHVKKVLWWINRAIKFIKPIKCNCHRSVISENQKEYDYYTIGKIF